MTIYLLVVVGVLPYVHRRLGLHGERVLSLSGLIGADCAPEGRRQLQACVASQVQRLEAGAAAEGRGPGREMTGNMSTLTTRCPATAWPGGETKSQ